MEDKPHMDFKPSFQISEFIGSVMLLIVLFVMQFKLANLTPWAIAVTVLCSGYIFCRGMFKKDRAPYFQKAGWRTSEFKAAWIGLALVGYRMWTGQVDLSLGMICLAVIWTAYNLSRGQAKSFTPHKTKVYNFG